MCLLGWFHWKSAVKLEKITIDQVMYYKISYRRSGTLSQPAEPEKFELKPPLDSDRRPASPKTDLPKFKSGFDKWKIEINDKTLEVGRNERIIREYCSRLKDKYVSVPDLQKDILARHGISNFKYNVYAKKLSLKMQRAGSGLLMLEHFKIQGEDCIKFVIRSPKSDGQSPTVETTQNEGAGPSAPSVPTQSPVTPPNGWSLDKENNDIEYDYHHSDGQTYPVQDLRNPDGSRDAFYWDSANARFIHFGESQRKCNADYQEE